MRMLVMITIVLIAAGAANGQRCPNGSDEVEAAEASSLHGTLVFHDELRKWLGIKLDQPTCGQEEVELVFSKIELWRKTQALRDCEITATGKLYYGITGYYSSEMAIMDPALLADPSCRPHKVEPDPAGIKIPTSLKTFHASITVDYRGQGHVNVDVWEGGSKGMTLSPWQAHVTYGLTGAADIVRFACRDGFQIKNIRQDPPSPGGFSEDIPNLVGTVLQDQNGRNVITFTCERRRTKNNVKNKSEGSQ